MAIATGKDPVDRNAGFSGLRLPWRCRCGRHKPGLKSRTRRRENCSSDRRPGRWAPVPPKPENRPRHGGVLHVLQRAVRVLHDAHLEYAHVVGGLVGDIDKQSAGVRPRRIGIDCHNGTGSGAGDVGRTGHLGYIAGRIDAVLADGVVVAAHQVLVAGYVEQRFGRCGARRGEGNGGDRGRDPGSEGGLPDRGSELVDPGCVENRAADNVCGDALEAGVDSPG